jgi:hypothetical protein
MGHKLKKIQLISTIVGLSVLGCMAGLTIFGTTACSIKKTLVISSDVAYVIHGQEDSTFIIGEFKSFNYKVTSLTLSSVSELSYDSFCYTGNTFSCKLKATAVPEATYPLSLKSNKNMLSNNIRVLDLPTPPEPRNDFNVYEFLGYVAENNVNKATTTISDDGTGQAGALFFKNNFQNLNCLSIIASTY